MPSKGDNLKDLVLLYRTLEWQYKISDYTDEALISIQKMLLQAQKGLVRNLNARSELMIESLMDLTLATQFELVQSIDEVVAIAGEASAGEYSRILSFDGDAVGVNTVALSPEQLRALVTEKPVSGALLGGWVDGIFRADLVDELSISLGPGLMQGESYRKLVERIPAGFELINRDVITLTRTYVAEANNQAAQAVYEANKDIINQVEWNSTLEVAREGRGTCLQCASLDGRRWDVGETHPTPPIHPRCRCILTPITASYKTLG